MKMMSRSDMNARELDDVLSSSLTGCERKLKERKEGNEKRTMSVLNMNTVRRALPFISVKFGFK
jgi:hypothetical protein